MNTNGWPHDLTRWRIYFAAPHPSHDSLNRYTYVGDNPLRYTDPSGLYLMLVCGGGQNCDNGNAGQNSIEQWREFTIQYWLSGRARVDFGKERAHLDFVFDLFAGALSRRDAFSAAGIVNTFDAFALDSSHNWGGGAHTGETDARRSASNLATAAEWIKASTDQDITYLAGFSWGAVTSYEYLYGVYKGWYYGTAPRGVYLVGGPNVFDLPFPFHSTGGIIQADAPGDFDIGAKFGAQVVARSARIESLDVDLGIPGLTVNIAGLLGEVNGGADLRAPFPGSCGHCVQGLASWVDSATVFR